MGTFLIDRKTAGKTLFDLHIDRIRLIEMRLAHFLCRSISTQNRIEAMVANARFHWGPEHFVEYLAMTDSAVRRQYDRLARGYDQRWSRYITQTLTFLKSWASIPPQATVLDIGCGTGEFEWLVLREHPEQRIVGVDVCGKMLELARQKCQAYPNVTFYTASASALPFLNHSFDVVVSASALHYFDQPDVNLAEMRRVVKPGGSVVILDWCKDYIWCRLLDIVLKLIEPAYQRCYTQHEFHRLLASARFDMQSGRRVRFGLVWGLMIATATTKSGS